MATARAKAKTKGDKPQKTARHAAPPAPAPRPADEDKADRERVAALATELGVSRAAIALEGDKVIVRLGRRQLDKVIR